VGLSGISESSNFQLQYILKHYEENYSTGQVKINNQFYFSLALQPPWALVSDFQFRNNFSQPVGLLGRAISPSQGLYLNTGEHKHRINAYTHQTSMPYVGFKPTIPAFELAKTDRSATVTGNNQNTVFNYGKQI
jgi:hypothetical protein